MPGKKALASACVTLTLFILLLGGCKHDYRQIVIIENGKAEFVYFGKGPKKDPKVWGRGRIIAFRTTTTVPGGPADVTGTAGHVYRVTGRKTMEEVAEFQLTVPNDSLAYTYGK